MVDNKKSECYIYTNNNNGGDNMTPSEFCKSLILQSPIPQKEVAEKIGLSEANLSKKLARNSLSADEYTKIIESLGYEIKVVEANTNIEAPTRTRGIGERIQMVVDGIRYDTYNADAVCHSEENSEFFYELYKDKFGRYFVAQYPKWDGGVNSISTISEENAAKMIARLRI